MSRLLRAGWWLALMLLVGGCGQTAATPPPIPSPAAAPNIQAIVAASTIVVGPNRLPIGIIDDGTPINDPQTKVHLRFFYLDDQASSQTAAGETDARYFGADLPFGVYVAYPTFPKAGGWGVEVQTTRPGKPTSTSRLRLDVLESDPTPALGSQAIPVESPTVNSVDDPRKLSSASEPDPALYQITVAEALKQGKPLALLFATPGFCKTAVCGPSIEVLRRLQGRYGTRVNFIHVEIYEYPYSESVQANPPRYSAGMEAWNLPSEPWLFLIDATGAIRYKYEGGITADELSPVFEELLK